MSYKDGLPFALAGESAFHIGQILVEPALRRISSPGAAAEALEPGVMQVLVVLAHASMEGSIVSREDLVKQCWDDRITTRDSINRVISLLRRVIRRHSGDQITVETLAKVGYRLSVPAAAAAAPLPPELPEPAEPRQQPATPPVRAPLRKDWRIPILLGLTGAALIGAAVWKARGDGAAPAVPVVAVLRSRRKAAARMTSCSRKACRQKSPTAWRKTRACA